MIWRCLSRSEITKNQHEKSARRSDNAKMKIAPEEHAD
jgi:hypothetical protein